MREVVVTSRSWPVLERGTDGDARVVEMLDRRRLGADPIQNLAAALGRLTGLSAYADMGRGQAATGNPEFVAIRGLDASYNGYTLNGLPAPQSDPNTRALSLKVLPTFGLGSVVVEKTPGADRPGDVIGGLVDVRTATAFDTPGDLTHLGVSGSLSALAARTGFDAGGGALRGEAARRFLGGRLGLYASAYVQSSNSVAEAGEVLGWAPSRQVDALATDYSHVPDLTAKGFRYDLYRNHILQYGGDADVTYRGPVWTLSAKLLASRYIDRGDDSQTSLREGAVNTGTDAKGRPLDFWGRPVGPGLPGDPAYARQGSTDAYDAQGRYAPYGVFAGDYYQLRDQSQDVYMAEGEARRAQEATTLVARAGYGYARQMRPDYLEASAYTPTLNDARLTIGWADSHTPTFRFSDPASAAFISNAANAALWKFQGEDSGSSDAVASAAVALDHAPGGAGRPRLQVGAGVSVSTLRQYDHDLFGAGDGNFTLVNAQGYATPYWAAAGPSVAAQPGDEFKGGFLGLPLPLKVFSRDYYLALARPGFETSQFALDPLTGVKDWPNPGAYTSNDYNQGSAGATETVSYAYASLARTRGGVMVAAGLRYEASQLRGRYWTPLDAGDGRYQAAGHAYGDWLPNLALAWRIEPRLLVRAALRRSLSRPAPSLLVSPAIVTGAGTVQVGNPALRPTTAINLDLSAEYRLEDATLRAAAFHKTLSHFIYTASTTGSPPDAVYGAAAREGVIYAQPQNGRDAGLDGLEVGVEYQARHWPGALSGLGAHANATFQQSQADSGRADHYGRRTWLPRAPQDLANLDLSWSGAGLRADLLMRHTGLQLANLTSYNVDNYFQPLTFLDAAVHADVGGFTVSLWARNLNDSPMLWKTFGRGRQRLGVEDGDGNGSYVLTGRTFEIGLERSW